EAGDSKSFTLNDVLAGRAETLSRRYSALLAQADTAAAALRIGADVAALPAEALGSLGISIPILTYDFCVPFNAVLSALPLRAELNLYKLHTCRNVAGMLRQLEPYVAPIGTGGSMPSIGNAGQLALPGTVTLQPTSYRYSVLIERAKQLVGL